MKLLLTCLLFTSFFGYSQTVMRVEEAKQNGTLTKVEKEYKGALGDDGIFKTEQEQQKHRDAYRNYLLDFGKFLEKNNFKWEETTKGWNRIYMQPDGTIDYFLYSFKNLPADKEKEFQRLLGLYIKDHKFGNTAPVKFAQCSSVTYPKSE
ncbi:hypothetical protein ACX0HA_11960 [Flavobacterium hauense]